MLLSEFNSCVELSKTLSIFGINISHDTINRSIQNEGFSPSENLFNYVKDFTHLYIPVGNIYIFSNI